MEESWRLLLEAKAFQERAWLEARIETKMKEMHSLMLADVEWKMRSFVKLLMEQESRAGTGPTSAGCTSWAMSPEERARLERWEKEEEEVRERRRKLKEAMPTVSLQRVKVWEAFHPDPRLPEACLRDEREVRMTAEQWEAIENEKRKEMRREIRERSAKLDKEKLQEDRKALEVEWKNLEKEKRKTEEERKEMERLAKVQGQQLEKEKRRESEAREREDDLRKRALANECELEKIGLERMKIEVVLKEVETQKQQLLEKRKKLKEKVAKERRTVATDKQRLKDEWEKVAEEKRRVEKERRELEQKEVELQRAQEIEKKQREYKTPMKEMEKEKQKTERNRKELMEEKTQKGNKEGDEVKQNMEITETVVKQGKAVEVAQGKTETARVHDDNSWDSDESNRGESSKPKAKCNIALMKAGSQESPVKELPKPGASAQDNEDNSWDSDEDVVIPSNAKATRAPTTQKATPPLKPGNVRSVPVKNTYTKKQGNALNDAELFDKELEEFEREMKVNRKPMLATTIQKAAVPVKASVDAELLDKELEELEKNLATGPNNRKPITATNIQKGTVPVKQGNMGCVAVQKKARVTKQTMTLDDEDFSDDLFDTDIEEKKATRKPAKEDPVDTDAIERELEKLNEELKDPKGSAGSLYSQRDKRDYEWKHKDHQYQLNSKGVTGSNLTGVKTPETQNPKENSPLLPKDAIHLKYLKGRRF